VPTPALFVSHGAPSIAIEEDAFTRALAAFGPRLNDVSAVVVVSAHWEARGAFRVTAAAAPPLIYDFYGFPDALYWLTYPAPGAPRLAQEIGERLSAAGLTCAKDLDRGFDHGVWVPLRLLLPDARVPVVALSLPVPRTPRDLLAAGRALAPLRERGVLLLGSGGVVHNLRLVRFGAKDAPVEDWARSFDEWVRDRLAAGDVEALADYRAEAPHAALAVPTSEHFDPLFFTLGAFGAGDRVESVFEGFHYGNLSMRGFAVAG
jgi:4,5-DOPA dioxygenase extradiol